MAYLIQNLEIVLYCLVFILGAAIGSFLNVVAYRLPKILFDRDYQDLSEFLIDESKKKERILSGIRLLDQGMAREDAEELFRKEAVLPKKGMLYLALPGSSCPNCNHKIKAHENIPILGWLLLKGKCAGCRNPISFQYPLIEFVTAVLSVAVVYVLGFTVEALCYTFLLWILISLTLIDLEYRVLPDCLTSPMIWLGLILSYFGIISLSFKAAFLGAIAGYLSLWLINQFSWLVFKKVGVGAGDFKLLALIGAWQGVGNLFNIILISSVTGAIVGLIAKLIRKDKDEYIPYGPFLALGSVIVLLLGLGPETFFYML